MIALNEILKNREVFENKYKQMGKNVHLERIFSLENKFILADKNANESRAICNKLCAEVADFINSGKDVKNSISQINKLDKKILSLEKKSKNAMKKINKILRKLPNPALEENTLNIPLKTVPNEEFTSKKLINELSKFGDVTHVNCGLNSYLKNQKNVVLKTENLPKLIIFSSKNNKKYKLLLLINNDISSIFDEITKLITSNTKYAVCSSIKYLKPCSAKEISAMFCDKSIINLEFLGEYVSRDISFKFYDKNQDMTKFVNMIKVEITCH